MARDPKYDVLFAPIKAGPKTLRNRFYVTPHCSGLGVQYPGAQAYLRGMRAEGGWAVVNTEACNITPESDNAPHVLACISSDHDVRNLALLCERAHDHGALAGVQLSFVGPVHTGFETRLPTRGVSQLPRSDRLGHVGHTCYEMSIGEIRELQRDFVFAAKRARTAGFDLIQLGMREGGSIPMQFLVKYWNKRTDEYGGSFENRARFARETLELIREAVGDDCAIVGGFCVDHLAYGAGDGVRLEEEGIGFIELIDELVDLWDLQVGQFDEDAASSRFFSQNWQRPWIEKVRPHTRKPIVGVGRFTDPDVMVEAIRSGQLDIIGAARPAIADPFLPRKIEEGRLDDIRECIGCNLCVSRFNHSGSRIVCTQNATCGEEYRRGWHPEHFRRARNADLDVLVVGAGPAGMECSMVLGKRGMRRVHLVEAEEELGGIMRWVPRFRGLAEWGRLVSYRVAQLSKLKSVEVLTCTRLNALAVSEYGADLVVIAAGARWVGDGTNPVTHRPIAGADPAMPYVLTPEQIMVDAKQAPGERVLVYDCEGYFIGASLAEKLALEGKQVMLVSPDNEVSAYLFNTHEGRPMMRSLIELGVELYPHHIVTSIKPGDVEGAYLHTPDQLREWSADSVVLVTHRRSNDSLYRDLTADPDALERAGIRGVFRTGDCLEPRTIADCIFDGHRLAREIDSDDPSKPLPFIWENRVLRATDTDYDLLLQGRELSDPSSVVREGGNAIDQ